MISPFEDFWTAGRATRATQRRLALRLAEYRPPADIGDPFVLPTPYLPLRMPRDRLQRIFRRRRSMRTFATAALPKRRLDDLLSALAMNEGRRTYPSAGALFPVRCYAALLNVDHPLGHRIVRYEPATHAVQPVGACPGWSELGPILGASPDADAPHVVLFFVLDDERVLAKYGERGGRFGLIETGCAVQSVALRLAASGLGGYLLGGAADDAALALVGVAGTGVRLAAALAAGAPR